MRILTIKQEHILLCIQRFTSTYQITRILKHLSCFHSKVNTSENEVESGQNFDFSCPKKQTKHHLKTHNTYKKYQTSRVFLTLMSLDVLFIDVDCVGRQKTLFYIEISKT